MTFAKLSTLQLRQIFHNLRARPRLWANELSAQHPVAVDHIGLGIAEAAVERVYVLLPVWHSEFALGYGVLALLRAQNIPGSWVRMVEEVTESEGEEQSQMFGESLPIGLRLVRSEE